MDLLSHLPHISSLCQTPVLKQPPKSPRGGLKDILLRIIKDEIMTDIDKVLLQIIIIF